ncbi:MAG: hypothetical protein QG622_2002, partial [Actinomycetota bacterium]|nr:hypothetical protein [Actinomycetota bacterium]
MRKHSSLTFGPLRFRRAVGVTAACVLTLGGAAAVNISPAHATPDDVASSRSSAARLQGVRLTAPVAGASFSTKAAVPLSVSTVGKTVGKTVSKVEYYSNKALIATTSTSPFTATWRDVPDGAYSITAKAYDSSGATVSTAPSGITVSGTPAVKVSPESRALVAGKKSTFKVSLSSAPSSDVTVTTAHPTGADGVAVASGEKLTFTPSTWATPQTVTVTSDAKGTPASVAITSSATGYSPATARVTEVAAATSEYDERFLTMYDKLKDPANGYFSKEGVPYHSVETLMVEAPDQGHETTSEAMSYLMWTEATYGRISGDWAPYNKTWTIAEKYFI